MQLLLFLGYGVAALFALSAVGVAVYLVGARMIVVKDAHEHVENRAAIWGWGVIYSIDALILLFLLVRFVKFAWSL